ncbi:MAG: D-aminoacyl-tRNA deacylase [Pirellulales bacterium]
MRACVQRVREASVTVGGEVVGRIAQGLVVLLGVARDDRDEDARYLADKIIGLRIFDDQAGKMNLSVAEIGGGLLVVSQFTLWGDCRKGRRPSYGDAAPPEVAEPLYETFVAAVGAARLPVATGRFRAEMLVALINDGPVTLWLDSRKAL